ncbi:hypothetical protein N7489_011602 [Penicillium chrysogenum]|uniref:Peptidase n=1 Tax=Penicillium chrysogenum TaxID=5076 RepID=A0ABQ8W053_PENCH|nr:uncharacterized protein N7489_011602 [Penicillium chrysogenum]KAJ5230894.1 hypothetical protein N7489_011602 [Penicillium chrysogenum]KAJ5253315.1 hypothetical protein N7505_011978 [Penicillium chrysogenum]KAJ5268371.1 hypothetical protein N7524_005830 [Penicillium chrysogenum]KAJ6162864.1 hypothetical protein N7497_002843 [Penicillium chrysogenum]
MCGRYALGVRLAYIRDRLQEQGMQVDEVPDDDAVRETYNFAPGNFGAVYRADITDKGSYDAQQDADSEHKKQDSEIGKDEVNPDTEPVDNAAIKYKLQSMKWGLIPFWTKRQPDYGSMMRTINCRDDSLAKESGMWTTMKRRKRCVVVCQGFYEWLKKGPGGKEKVPHFIRRKDGELMCFAGLWDCVSYEGSDEKLYTYTVITTSSNPYLKFLHERMPVILEPGSEAMNKWLDPRQKTWSKELQSILKPYEGELECYPVPKEVGKVGNNSPNFIVPVDSKENKSNIANFFANAKTQEKLDPSPKKDPVSLKVKTDQAEHRATEDSEWTEDNAPKPVPAGKREHTPEAPADAEESKKRNVSTDPTEPSPQKKKLRSATYNSPMKKSGGTKAADGSQRITSFFNK